MVGRWPWLFRAAYRSDSQRIELVRSSCPLTHLVSTVSSLAVQGRLVIVVVVVWLMCWLVADKTCYSITLLGICSGGGHVVVHHLVHVYPTLLLSIAVLVGAGCRCLWSFFGGMVVIW